MKIVFFNSAEFEISKYSQENETFSHQLDFVAEPLSEANLNVCIGAEAISVFVSNKLDETLLEKISKVGVKYILLRSTGYDHVDLDAAKKFGIKVMNVPDYSPSSVAEHALLLTLMLLKKIKHIDSRIEEANFSLEGLMGAKLSGKTVGVVGYGKIGSAFAKLLQGFDCEVLVYDPYVEVLNANDKSVNLEQLLQTSDIISLHCPLNSETQYLLDKQALKNIKPTALIVNTGRGPLINTRDLLEALDENQIAGAGLDVYEYEAGLFFKDHEGAKIDDELFLELVKRKNVLVTPHTAFFTDEAVKNIANIVLQNAQDLEQSGHCANQV